MHRGVSQEMNLNDSSASKPSLSHCLSCPEGNAGRCSKPFCCLTGSVETQCLRQSKQTLKPKPRMTDLSHLWISRPFLWSPSAFLEFLGAAVTLHPKDVLPVVSGVAEGFLPFLWVCTLWKFGSSLWAGFCSFALMPVSILSSSSCSVILAAFPAPHAGLCLLMAGSSKAVIYFWEFYLMCVSIACTSDLRVLVLERVNNPNRNGKPFTASFCGIKASAVYGRNLMIPFRKIYFDIIF